MRISDIRHALISAVAGSVLVMAGTAAPAQAQFFGFNFNFGFGGQNSVKPAQQAPAVSDPGRAPLPVPPADVPLANVPAPAVQVIDPQSPVSGGQGGTASGVATASMDGDATPLSPDAPVATNNLPEPTGSAASAADAALDMANMMDGAGGGVSNADLMSSLQNAAAAGQPMALWRLGTMYENGDGVAKDDVKAFGYFSQIANDHADAAPRGVDADIVAQSFVKMGDYYRQGLPDAGIDKDPDRAEQLLLHAATYFGNADAQYQVGELYLNADNDPNPLQGARWLSLAAHKGHVAAQAKLGDLLFNGSGLKAQPTEGLMWLSIAHDRSSGTPDEGWIAEMLTRDMSVATPNERADAIRMATAVEPSFGDEPAPLPGH